LAHRGRQGLTLTELVLTDTVKSLSRLLRKVFGERLDPDAETFAEDGVMEFPYAIPCERRIEGRKAIADHLEANAGKIEFHSVADIRAHETGDPEVVIIEFAGFGQSVSTGMAFEQRNISVIRARSGRIVHYVDYWNPIAILRTLRGEEFIEALVI
jgi:ketosteroid isomerase-like protein